MDAGGPPADRDPERHAARRGEVEHRRRHAGELRGHLDEPRSRRAVRHVTPARYRPGIGLRPGGERPDWSGSCRCSTPRSTSSVAAHSRLGLNVVVDVGHHDAYSVPLGILPDCARRAGGPAGAVRRRALLPIDAIMDRRRKDVDRPGGKLPLLRCRGGRATPSAELDGACVAARAVTHASRHAHDCCRDRHLRRDVRRRPAPPSSGTAADEDAAVDGPPTAVPAVRRRRSARDTSTITNSRSAAAATAC